VPGVRLEVVRGVAVGTHWIVPRLKKRHWRTVASTKKPPGNRVAFSLGRIVPTEARPSELSWRHSMGGLLGCQGQIIFAVNGRFYGICSNTNDNRYHLGASPFIRHNPNGGGGKPRFLCVLLAELHQLWFNLGQESPWPLGDKQSRVYHSPIAAHRKFSLMNSISSTDEADFPRATR
jgi:hypothetical protein